MDVTVQADGVTVTKHKQEILTPLTFTIEKGSITGLIGPSGSGKTTLMRTIVGVQRYKGTLSVLGKAAGSRTLRPRIGYVTQSPAIYDDLTVLQNLHYFATIASSSRRDVQRIIDTVSLTKHAKKLTRDLSGGERARVSLAIALLGDADLLVLDEPTVGLDPVLREELWQLFQTLADNGKTLIISSHVMDEAERCKKLLLMRGGALLWTDTKEKLLETTNTNSVNKAFIAMVKEHSA